MNRRVRPFAWAMAIVSTVLLAACETTVTTSDGTAPAPKPRQAPATPQGSRPNAMAVTFAPKPADSDGNQLPDTLQVTAYLFARPHPTPMYDDGSFHFAIYRTGQAGTPEAPGATPIRAWSFDSEAVRAARDRALAGPCHEFTLSLLANRGSDALPVESVDLVAWFEPAAGGDAVWLRGVRTVQFARPEGR